MNRNQPHTHDATHTPTAEGLPAHLFECHAAEPDHLDQPTTALKVLHERAHQLELDDAQGDQS